MKKTLLTIKIDSMKPSILGILLYSTIMSSSHAIGIGYDASVDSVELSASTTASEPKDQKTLDTTLLSTEFKSRGRNSVYKIDLTSECGLKRFTVSTGSSATENHSQVIALAKVWAEVDGVVVPIAPISGTTPVPSDGQARLCSWLEWDRALQGNRDDIKSAAGFSWVTTGIPSGKHLLEIKANLSVSVVSEMQAANAGSIELGRRTLTISQIK